MWWKYSNVFWDLEKTFNRCVQSYYHYSDTLHCQEGSYLLFIDTYTHLTELPCYNFRALYYIQYWPISSKYVTPDFVLQCLEEGLAKVNIPGLHGVDMGKERVGICGVVWCGNKHLITSTGFRCQSRKFYTWKIPGDQYSYQIYITNINIRCTNAVFNCNPLQWL